MLLYTIGRPAQVQICPECCDRMTGRCAAQGDDARPMTKTSGTSVDEVIVGAVAAGSVCWQKLANSNPAKSLDWKNGQYQACHDSSFAADWKAIEILVDGIV